MKNNTHCADAQMLIRKPAADVYNAFIDPAITTKFWFTKSSGKLEVNKEVTWQWEMYNVSTKVVAKELVPNERIVFDWGTPATLVTFNFQAIDKDTTYVTVTECGYDKTGDELISIIRDSTGGFTTVVDGLKAYLEFGIQLNLVGDKFLSK
jgi:uncharacterized protein YndB with AHSA1/START domain